jgi:tungstate transport system permease protein
MGFLADSVRAAFSLIVTADRDVLSAVWTSASIAAGSIVLASLAGIPCGMQVGIGRFPGKRVAIIVLNSLTAVPTVVVGLVLYGLLSREGPLGSLGLLFTRTAILIGQACLAAPIVASYTLSAVKGADPRIVPSALTLGASRLKSILLLTREIRFGIVAAIIAGFGRVISEVGVAMMLGGNIRWYTRTMTTAIALQTSKGEFAYGLALGILLMVVSFSVNIVLSFLQESHSG